MNYFNKEIIYIIIFIILLVYIIKKFRFWKEYIWWKSYWIRRSIFTNTEFKFYNSLNAFLWKNNLFIDYRVFSKIRLIDIFYANKKWNGKENKNMVYKILAKHIDFIITDKKWSPVLLIELDDKYHSWRKYYKSDNLKDDLCKYTWMPLLRFNASNYYNFDELFDYL